MMALEKELKVYSDKLPELLGEHAGKFVLIGDDAILGIFAAYEDALNAGYKACGLKPFLVKRIEAIESAQRLTRNVSLCRT